MSRLKLSDLEKNILREVAAERATTQKTFELALNAAQSAATKFQQVVDTVIRMRKLDADKYQLAFDLEKDTWELQEKPKRPKMQIPGAVGKLNTELVAAESGPKTD